MKDYSGYTSDKHANSRDRKSMKRAQEKLMRGNRSVHLIQDVIIRKGRDAKRRLREKEETS